MKVSSSNSVNVILVATLLFSLLFVAVTSSVGVYDSIINTSALAESGAWLSGWDYRKGHVINQQVGCGTNYQVGVKVYYGAGIDGTEIVEGVEMGKLYCGGKCRSDFGDIRFTASDGTTEWDYYLESKTDGSFAVFWVEIRDDLSAGSVRIYVYYGNAMASTTESGTDTFIEYSSFDNLDGWTLGGLGENSSVSNDYPFKGANGLKHQTQDSFIKKDRGVGIQSVATRIRYYDQMSPNTEVTALDAWDQFGVWGMVIDADTIDSNIYKARMGYSYYSITGQSVGWHLFEISVSNNVERFSVDGVVCANTLSVNDIQRSYVGSHWVVNNVTGYYDEFIMRKYVSPEPTHGGWDVSPPVIHAVEWVPTCPEPYVPATNVRPGEPVAVYANVSEEAEGSGISSVMLVYRIDGGEWWNTSMTLNSTSGWWTTIIPGQPANVTVEFCVEALDNSGNRVNSTVFGYVVEWLILGDFNGDGIVDMRDIGLAARNFGKTNP